MVYKRFEVTRRIIDIYVRDAWSREIDAVVSQFTDAELMRFLTKREIPIWASILSIARRRNLRKDEMTHLTHSMVVLRFLHNEYPNAVTSVALEYLISFIDELNRLEQVTLCPQCANVIPFRKGKKCCSLRSDGRDCGKRARNKRYYSEHGEALREKNKRDMKLYRDLVKAVNKDRE